MGISEEGKSLKSEKSSPPASASANEQGNVQVYPDWTAMQAYYGPRVALTPYFNPAVPSGHPLPPYMWGSPQPMMQAYGPPYAAIYAHGGVYAHPTAPFGTQPHGQGVSSPPIGTPMSIEAPAKLPENGDKGLLKKLKGFDGLAMSIGNGDVIKAENRPSKSSVETEGSSDGSDGNTEEADQSKRKRSREGTPTYGIEDEKTGIKVKPATDKAAPSGQLVVHVRGTSSSVSPPSAVISSETWLQIQNEKEIKREKRKQSNRESARRSRLRKQAETEELARKVDSLNAENAALKSEINQLVESSQKLHHENTTLVEKLKIVQSGQEEQDSLTTLDVKRNPTDSTENLLSKVNNGGRSSDEAAETYEKGSKSGAKFHHLIDRNRRADVVAAG